MLTRPAAPTPWIPAIIGAGLAVFQALAAVAQPAPPACAGRSLLAALPDGGAAVLDRVRRDIPNAEGLFWRIERPGLAPSHLFGTKHATDAETVTLAPTVRAALGAARVVAVEQADILRPGPASDRLAQELAAHGLAAADTGLALPAADRARLDQALRARGLPLALARRVRPWFANVLLAAPLCEQARVAAGLPTLDAVVANARPAGARLVSLETINEQIATLRDMPADVAERALAWTVRHLDRHDDLYATLKDLYAREVPYALIEVTVEAGLATAEDRRTQLALIAALGGDRDRRIAARALPLLEQGGAFIAVGALHLPGPGGLIERFRAAGYAVTRVR
jgi:uncharacterized protein YbaP (TraB family)